MISPRLFKLRLAIERSTDPAVRTPQEYEACRIARAVRVNPGYVHLPRGKRGRKLGSRNRVRE